MTPLPDGVVSNFVLLSLLYLFSCSRDFTPSASSHLQGLPCAVVNQNIYGQGSMNKTCTYWYYFSRFERNFTLTCPDIPFRGEWGAEIFSEAPPSLFQKHGVFETVNRDAKFLTVFHSESQRPACDQPALLLEKLKCGIPAWRAVLGHVRETSLAVRCLSGRAWRAHDLQLGCVTDSWGTATRWKQTWHAGERDMSITSTVSNT